MTISAANGTMLNPYIFPNTGVSGEASFLDTLARMWFRPSTRPKVPGAKSDLDQLQLIQAPKLKTSCMKRELTNIQQQEVRHGELRTYLDELREAMGSDGVEVIENAWDVWEMMREEFITNQMLLRVPDACGGDDGRLMFTWSLGPHYLEYEFLPDGVVEYFYRNRETEDLFGEDLTWKNPLSDDALSYLSLFVVTG